MSLLTWFVRKIWHCLTKCALNFGTLQFSWVDTKTPALTSLMHWNIAVYVLYSRNSSEALLKAVGDEMSKAHHSVDYQQIWETFARADRTRNNSFSFAQVWHHNNLSLAVKCYLLNAYLYTLCSESPRFAAGPTVRNFNRCWRDLKCCLEEFCCSQHNFIFGAVDPSCGGFIAGPIRLGYSAVG